MTKPGNKAATPSFTVIGAKGFIGSALVDELRRQGARVCAVDRVTELPGDNLGHVVFAAGVTADFRRRPLDTVEAHVGALVPVLGRAVFDSLLYLSSTRVYQGAAATDEGSALCVYPSDADQLYNVSKIAGEAMCLAQDRPEIRIARLSNVFGARDRSQTLIASLIEEAQTGHMLLRSAKESERDFIHIDDVVQILPRLIAGSHRIYNVASGTNTAYGSVVECLSELSGADVTWKTDGSATVVRPIDVSRISEEFNFTATPFKASISRVWMQRQGIS